MSDDNGITQWKRAIEEYKKAADEYYKARREHYKPIVHDGEIDISFETLKNSIIEHPHITASLLAIGILLSMLGRKRFPTAMDVPSKYIKSCKIVKGLALMVNDSDNLRVYHMPLYHRIMYNLGLLKRSSIKQKENLINHTINVRLAGIDCPEGPHFGKPGQPYFEESKKLLEKLVMNKMISIKFHKIDQYQRAVCSVYRPYMFFFSKNVSLEMIRSGMATVYKDSGAEYGGIYDDLTKSEAVAR